ncbi:hypothetical protein BBJ28_00008259 [Nothophytophthora sp. Chile5]|nr:hypothetical protein BBJ28_00008259 [Nothophytophthora sp. Chile5]
MDVLLPFLLAFGGNASAEVATLLAVFDQPERPIIPDVRLHLVAMTDANAKSEFRFYVHGVLELARVFDLPEFIIPPHRDKVHMTEALCILLSRLSYPKLNYDMMHRFDQSKGAPRSGKKENLQKQVYSGHKRIQCLNFQAAVAPYSLAIHCWGRVEGRQHDIIMLRESKLSEYVASYEYIFTGYIIFRDPAYVIQPFLVSGFKGARVASKEQQFNTLMSSVGEIVEWKFGRPEHIFAFIDYKTSLKTPSVP